MREGYSVLDRLRHVYDAPLVNLRLSLWWLRKTLFTRPRSDAPAVFVPLDKPTVVRCLGQHHFEPGWSFSYYYREETLNLRRPEYYDHESGYRWWQVHVRGYERLDGLELTAHFETDPIEHPDAHVENVGLDVDRGMRALKEILDAHDVPYDPVDSPRPNETIP